MTSTYDTSKLKIRYAFEQKRTRIVFSVYNKYEREIGYCIFGINGDIEILYIEKEYRSRGVGKYCLTESIKLFHKLVPSIQIITVEASPIIDNTDLSVLEKFYKSCGFSIVNRLTNTTIPTTTLNKTI